MLRKSLRQINNALYIEFENVTKWAMNRMNKLKVVRLRYDDSSTNKQASKYSGHLFKKHTKINVSNFQR